MRRPGRPTYHYAPEERDQRTVCGIPLSPDLIYRNAQSVESLVARSRHFRICDRCLSWLTAWKGSEHRGGA